MYDYKLQSHCKSDKIKWVLTLIGFLLAFVMIAGLCMQLFAKDDKYKPSSWFTKTECEHEFNEDGVCEKCGAWLIVDEDYGGEENKK